MIFYKWYVTHDMWHMTHDTWEFEGSKPFLKSSPPWEFGSEGMFKIFLQRMAHSLDQLNNHKYAFIAYLAAPGSVKHNITKYSRQHLFK